MIINIPSIRERFHGTPVEIVREMANNKWQQLEKVEYMVIAAKRAKIQTGKTVRPWSASLFLEDLKKANLIIIIEE